LIGGVCECTKNGQFLGLFCLTNIQLREIFKDGWQYRPNKTGEYYKGECVLEVQRAADYDSLTRCIEHLQQQSLLNSTNQKAQR
jgi:hypothetical protein